MNLFLYLCLSLRYFYFKTLFGLFSILFLSGCCGRLNFYSEYINEDSFAAAKVGLKDIQDPKSLEGQQIVINWSLPKKYVRLLPLSLALTVRYGSGVIETIRHSIDVCSGFWIFRIQSRIFEEKKGISSYKVSIEKGNQELMSDQHHLWAEVISIPEF